MSGRRTVPVKCLFCSKAFKAVPSEVARGRGKYCAKKCWNRSRVGELGRNRKTGTMRHRGYILEWAPKHPNNVKGYVYQHRLIMERKLNRFLERKELVHHKNHKKSDNRLCNLQVVSSSQHRTLHANIFVRFKGKKLYYADALRLLGIVRSSFYNMRVNHGWTHQRTFNHYIRNGVSRTGHRRN